MASADMISAKKKVPKQQKTDLTELEKLNLTMETLQAQKMLLVAQEKERKKTARAAQKAVEKELAADKKQMRASTVSYQKGKLKESDIKQETSEKEE